MDIKKYLDDRFSEDTKYNMLARNASLTAYMSYKDLSLHELKKIIDRVSPGFECDILNELINEKTLENLSDRPFIRMKYKPSDGKISIDTNTNPMELINGFLGSIMWDGVSSGDKNVPEYKDLYEIYIEFSENKYVCSDNCKSDSFRNSILAAYSIEGFLNSISELANSYKNSF